jgi:hypothetical protein
MYTYPNESAESMAARMEIPLNQFPEITRVKVGFIPADYKPTCIMDFPKPERYETVEIPTEEIFVPGSWLARRHSATPFWKIERWLNAHGIYNVTMQIENN